MRVAGGEKLFFWSSLGKIEGVSKVCAFASSHTYAAEKVHDEIRISLACTPLLNPGSAPEEPP